MKYVAKKKPEPEPTPQVEQTPEAEEEPAKSKTSTKLSEANQMLKELTEALQLARKEMDATKATYNSEQVRINQIKEENKRLRAEIREQESHSGNGNERLLQRQLKDVE